MLKLAEGFFDVAGLGGSVDSVDSDTKWESFWCRIHHPKSLGHDGWVEFSKLQEGKAFGGKLIKMVTDEDIGQRVEAANFTQGTIGYLVTWMALWIVMELAAMAPWRWALALADRVAVGYHWWLTCLAVLAALHLILKVAKESHWHSLGSFCTFALAVSVATWVSWVCWQQ
jgi:hypothetical protein